MNDCFRKNGVALFNRDCLDVLHSFPDESIDLIVTDPPYTTTPRGNAGNSGGMLQKKINKDGKVFTHNNITALEYAPEFYRLLKDGSHCYIMTNHIHLIEFLNTFTDLRTNEERKQGKKPYGFHFIKSLIWNKGNKIQGQFYMSQFEYILFFRKGRGVKINNCGTADILDIPNKKTKGTDGKNLHDTEKPVELMKILIKNSSQPNQIVLDPFAGIGGVPRACVQSGRKCVACEIDPTYYETMTELVESEILCKL